MVSRLRTAGITGRVDRGLGPLQVGQRNQITVLVREHDAKRAAELLGPTRMAAGAPERLLQVAIWVVVALIAFGVFALLASRVGQ